MPSISEPERKGSTPSPAAKTIFEHPNDECQCSHKRSEHAATKGILGTLPCRAEDENFNYVDNCTDFKLHKTALQAMVDRVQPGDTIRIHGGDAADVIDLLTRIKSDGIPAVNKPCTCGHAALVHTAGTGNCLALGYSNQEDSHCLDFRPAMHSCPECGHDIRDHNRRDECRNLGCPCAPADTVEHPETACQCGTGDTHQYGDPECVVFWSDPENEPDDDEDNQHEVAVESYGEPEDRDMWFPAAPGPAEPVERDPVALPGVVAAYRVVYKTDNDSYHAIDVPYGVNASVIDGQLRLWHASEKIVAITANITSVQEHSQ